MFFCFTATPRRRFVYVNMFTFGSSFLSSPLHVRLRRTDTKSRASACARGACAHTRAPSRRPKIPFLPSYPLSGCSRVWLHHPFRPTRPYHTCLCRACVRRPVATPLRADAQLLELAVGGAPRCRTRGFVRPPFSPFFSLGSVCSSPLLISRRALGRARRAAKTTDRNSSVAQISPTPQARRRRRSGHARWQAEAPPVRPSSWQLTPQ